MNFKKTLTFLVLVFTCLSISSCKLFKKCDHIDANDDAKCDKCEKDFEDGIDVCVEHIDSDGNNHCDICNEELEDVNIDKYNCISIAEAIELAEKAGDTGTTEKYYVRGIIETVSNGTYGEMTIKDETGSLFIYGVWSKDEQTRYDAMEDKPIKGDEVVLYGILKTYNGKQEMDRGYLQEFKHNEPNLNIDDYKQVSMAEAREANEGEKVSVEGVVVRITYANGFVPNGFYLVGYTGSIYVYGKEIAGQVKLNGVVRIAGEKTYYVLESEQANADKFGYKGCCQIQNAVIVSRDDNAKVADYGWVKESTIKEIMETPVSENITTNIYKVNALVKKVVGTGFTNYYFDDLDGVTGSYVYTACNGSDFAWLDEFDGKICTVYLSPINAKSTASGCIYRFMPIVVKDENFTFDQNNGANFAIEYYAKGQFLSLYESNPESLLISSVSNELINLNNVQISYSSNNEDVVYFENTTDGIVFNTKNEGKAIVTITATYNGQTSVEEVEIEVRKPVEYETISVADAIASADGTIVTLRGIVASSLVNQSGFYLIDNTGIIAVKADAAAVELLSVGDEVIIQGTKGHKTKDGFDGAGQINVYDSTILVNLYGNNEYDTSNFNTTTSVQELYDLDYKEDHSTQVYVIQAVIVKTGSGYSSGYSLQAVDGEVAISLYCSGAGQYSFLEEFVGEEVTIEVAMCNWNSKKYYRGCVISVTYNGVKVNNTLNFAE